MDTSFLAVNNPMAEQALTTVSQNWGISISAAILILVALMVWELVWKLIGMWKAARKGSWIWFIVLALLNTLGILPILYIFIFSKWGKKKNENTRPAKRRRR